MDTIQHQIAVIGPVVVDIINQAIHVSVTTQRPVVLDNISLEIAAIHVHLLHQMPTIQPLGHVTGLVVLDILDLETAV